MSEYIVEMKHITKRFPGIVANDDVSIGIKKGEIFALLGENGAGKSTLMSMLFGMYEPDEGEIWIRGKKEEIHSPSYATKLSIGMVHQHFKLVQNYSITENIILGLPVSDKRFGILPYVDLKKAGKKVQELSEHYGLEVNPEEIIEHVGISVQQRVEILKMLYREAEILIFDEPTAVLTPQETEELFVQLKTLKKAGYTIIFISHKLNEVKELCDRISIIRQGRFMGVFHVSDVTEQEISNLMVGREVLLTTEKEPAKPGNILLSVQNLSFYAESNKAILDKLFFDLREGEILGIAGVEGNGQRELVEALTGLLKYQEGSIKVQGKDIQKASVQEIRKLSVAHIPEDRMITGMAHSLSILENALSDKMDLPRFSKRGILKEKELKKYGEEITSDYQIFCKNPDVRIDSLSGGNIQKVVLARELSSSPKIIIANQPTRGVDVGATEFIRKRLIGMRDNGSCVLLISSDLNEILGLSDSLIVLHEGKIAAYFSDTSSISEKDLGAYMLGIKKQSETEIREAVHG